jgi:quinolinate phosphoribosyl transferase, C-terminal domain protein
LRSFRKEKTPASANDQRSVIPPDAQTECSGNVTKANIARLTNLGVDYIFSGVPSHSASILDGFLKNLHFAG